MRSAPDLTVSLFVRNQANGRLVFNSKAIQALGFSPAELRERGYVLDDETAGPAMAPDEQHAGSAGS